MLIQRYDERAILKKSAEIRAFCQQGSSLHTCNCSSISLTDKSPGRTLAAARTENRRHPVTSAKPVRREGDNVEAIDVNGDEAEVKTRTKQSALIAWSDHFIADPEQTCQESCKHKKVSITPILEDHRLRYQPHRRSQWGRFCRKRRIDLGCPRRGQGTAVSRMDTRRSMFWATLSSQRTGMRDQMK